MGITGLIPFLEKASSIVNLEQLERSSVAVDSYCWLHKGVFACAEKLVRGETTDIHIKYCLKYVDMLLRHKIKVIMVFDGRHLPAKSETERKRREARNESKKLAKEYLRRNEIEKARSHMRRAVDVTHEMALELIRACRDRGVDCIVAPYEADAQMAWLNDQGLAEYVITEDSDLTLFGAKKILFKLDLTGQALLVESTKLYLAMGCRPEKYTFDKFRRMCILSGCDYLDSLQGIGLKKACKFMLTTEEDDMTKALKKLPSYLKIKQLDVTDEYIESFLKAEATFKHMFIYNPLEKRMQRLHELEEFQTDECHCVNAGSILDSREQAFQLALGNLNPFTLKQIDDWHPNRSWSQNKPQYKSIWLDSANSNIELELSKPKQNSKEEKSKSIFHFKKIEFKNMAETEIAEKISEEKSKLDEAEIFSMYKDVPLSTERKRKRVQSSSSSSEDDNIGNTKDSGEPLPKYAHNPFVKVSNSLEDIKKSPVCSNNSLLRVLSPKKCREKNVNQETKEPKISVKSRFFAENVKQIKKPFAARDLTSEMFEIEKKTTAYMQRREDLYLCSLQSPEKKVEKNERSPDDSNQDSEAESVRYINETSVTDTDTKPIESSDLNDEIILIADIEEQYCKKPTLLEGQKFTSTYQKTKMITSKINNKPQTASRKVNNSSGTVDPKQSKLSMFGFQKRPSLKKL